MPFYKSDINPATLERFKKHFTEKFSELAEQEALVNAAMSSSATPLSDELSKRFQTFCDKFCQGLHQSTKDSSKTSIAASSYDFVSAHLMPTIYTFRQAVNDTLYNTKNNKSGNVLREYVEEYQRYNELSSKNNIIKTLKHHFDNLFARQEFTKDYSNWQSYNDFRDTNARKKLNDSQVSQYEARRATMAAYVIEEIIARPLTIITKAQQEAAIASNNQKIIALATTLTKKSDSQDLSIMRLFYSKNTRHSAIAERLKLADVSDVNVALNLLDDLNLDYNDPRIRHLRIEKREKFLFSLIEAHLAGKSLDSVLPVTPTTPTSSISSTITTTPSSTAAVSTITLPSSTPSSTTTTAPATATTPLIPLTNQQIIEQASKYVVSLSLVEKIILNNIILHGKIPEAYGTYGREVYERFCKNLKSYEKILNKDDQALFPKALVSKELLPHKERVEVARDDTGFGKDETFFKTKDRFEEETCLTDSASTLSDVSFIVDSQVPLKPKQSEYYNFYKAVMAKISLPAETYQNTLLNTKKIWQRVYLATNNTHLKFTFPSDYAAQRFRGDDRNCHFYPQTTTKSAHIICAIKDIDGFLSRLTAQESSKVSGLIENIKTLASTRDTSNALAIHQEFQKLTKVFHPIRTVTSKATASSTVTTTTTSSSVRPTAVSTTTSTTINNKIWESVTNNSYHITFTFDNEQAAEKFRACGTSCHYVAPESGRKAQIQLINMNDSKTIEAFISKLLLVRSQRDLVQPMIEYIKKRVTQPEASLLSFNYLSKISAISLAFKLIANTINNAKTLTDGVSELEIEALTKDGSDLCKAFYSLKANKDEERSKVASSTTTTLTSLLATATASNTATVTASSSATTTIPSSMPTTTPTTSPATTSAPATWPFFSQYSSGDPIAGNNSLISTAQQTFSTFSQEQQAILREIILNPRTDIEGLSKPNKELYEGFCKEMQEFIHVLAIGESDQRFGSISSAKQNFLQQVVSSASLQASALPLGTVTRALFRSVELGKTGEAIIFRFTSNEDALRFQINGTKCAYYNKRDPQTGKNGKKFPGRMPKIVLFKLDEAAINEFLSKFTFEELAKAPKLVNYIRERAKPTVKDWYLTGPSKIEKMTVAFKGLLNKINDQPVAHGLTAKECELIFKDNDSLTEAAQAEMSTTTGSTMSYK